MKTIEQAIESAKKVMTANNLESATIWKVGKSFNFNFENKDLGYSVKEFGVKRTVVYVVK